MQLIFVRPRTARAALTCLLTLSAWSHVAIVDGDHVIDSMDPQGVRRRTMESFLQAFPKHAVMDVPCPFDSVGLAWAREQIGRPYDREALWGVFLPGRRWDTEDAWYCAELAARALVAAFHDIRNVRKLWEMSCVSPGSLRALIRQTDRARASAAAGEAQ